MNDLRSVPLLQPVLVGIVVSSLIWFTLDAFQSRQFRKLASDELGLELGYSIREVRARIDAYRTRFKRLSLLLADSLHLNQGYRSSATEEKRHPFQLPEWLPPISYWRDVFPSFFFILDNRGELIHYFSPSRLQLAEGIQQRLSILRIKTLNQVIFFEENGALWLAVSAPLVQPLQSSSAKEDNSVYLLMLRKVDNELMQLIYPYGGGDSLIVAMGIGSPTLRVVASNSPDPKIVPGVSLEELKEDYVVAGSAFHDYGSAEVHWSVTVLLPIERASRFADRLLATERGQRILLSLVMIVVVGGAMVLRLSMQSETRLRVSRDKLEASLQQLKQAQFQLVESEKMAALGGLVAGVAHEINTPLGVGVTAVSHLQSELCRFSMLYEQQKLRKRDFNDFLDTANESVKILEMNLSRASGLIHSFKQVATDQSSEEQRRFFLKQILDDVMMSLWPRFKRTPHRFNVECNEKLELESYPGAFFQIITNLAINALDHGFSRNTPGLLTIRAEMDTEGGREGWFKLIVSDDGKGVEAEHLKQIFDPFFTTGRSQGNTGLGLHVVYNLVVQKLAGEIRCDSEEGKGTTFTIRLPINHRSSNSHE